MQSDKHRLHVQKVKEAQPLTLEEAKAKLQQDVYAATKFLEELEAAGKLIKGGSAHGARIRIVNKAIEELEFLWQ